MTEVSEVTGASNARAAIIEAARRLFAEKGFEGVTLRLIGKEVGLHNSSLMHHFGSKRDIILAALIEVADKNIALLKPLETDNPPSLDRFIQVMKSLSDWYAEDRDAARIGMRVLMNPSLFLDEKVELENASPTNPENRLRPFMQLLIDWLTRAEKTGIIRPVDPFQATRLILGMLYFEPIWTTAAHIIDQSDKKRRSELEKFIRGALAPTG